MVAAETKCLENRLPNLVGDKGFKLGGPPNPVIVTTRDNRDHIGALLYSYYITITGWSS